LPVNKSICLVQVLFSLAKIGIGEFIEKKRTAA